MRLLLKLCLHAASRTIPKHAVTSQVASRVACDMWTIQREMRIYYMLPDSCCYSWFFSLETQLCNNQYGNFIFMEMKIECSPFHAISVIFLSLLLWIVQ